MDHGPSRTVTARESPEVPPLGLVLGFGPMLPLVAGAAAAWWLRGAAGERVADLTILFGCAILLFLSGVRRGLSFRTEGGPTVPQIATALALFGLGLAALIALALGARAPALLLAIAGYAALAVLDPIAARRGEAPLFFARLRPFQTPIAALSLAALLALDLTS